mmetsp:Transcript_102806/g.178317  ORF Transcript_102806/g.178317 Transcript_102806/m.178317 type:complete len:324 (+) Transcript_102806:146-1117(+)
MKGYGTAGAGAVYYPKGFEEGEYIEAPVMKAVPLSRMEWSFMDYVAAFAVLVFPWVMFTGVYYVISFETHLKQPSLCWFLIGLAVFGVVAAIVGAFIEFNNKAGRQAIWATSMALSLSFALVIGMTVSESNYNSFMLPYYTWSSLNSYQNVDPGKLGGEAFMDAGKVTFSSNTALDLTKSAGFLNLDMFCVAPIVSSSGPSAREAYDFWAVGTNCCSGNSADFHCGAFNVKGASGGLRVLADADRDFYRLAVNQAAATFNLQVKHPVFFHWVTEANFAVDEHQEQGLRNFAIGVVVYFVFQVLVVLITFLLVGILFRPKFIES